MKRIIATLALLLVGCGEAPPPPGFVVQRGPGPSQALSVWRPSGATGALPTVIFFHGGAFRAGSPSDGEKYARHLCGKGLEVVSVGYRLCGPGTTWPAPLDDARDALRYVRANAAALGVGKVGVMGASAGACLAELLALERDSDPPACLVSISGYGNVRDPGPTCFDFEAIVANVFGHVPQPRELEELSPALRARPGVPALVVHSELDGDVFVAQSDRFAASMRAAGADVTYFRRTGWAHGDDLWQQDGGARAEVAAFLLEHLR